MRKVIAIISITLLLLIHFSCNLPGNNDNNETNTGSAPDYIIKLPGNNSDSALIGTQTEAYDFYQAFGTELFQFVLLNEDFNYWADNFKFDIVFDPIVSSEYSVEKNVNLSNHIITGTDDYSGTITLNSLTAKGTTNFSNEAGNPPNKISGDLTGNLFATAENISNGSFVINKSVMEINIKKCIYNINITYSTDSAPKANMTYDIDITIHNYTSLSTDGANFPKGGKIDFKLIIKKAGSVTIDYNDFPEDSDFIDYISLTSDEIINEIGTDYSCFFKVYNNKNELKHDINITLNSAKDYIFDSILDYNKNLLPSSSAKLPILKKIGN